MNTRTRRSILAGTPAAFGLAGLVLSACGGDARETASPAAPGTGGAAKGTPVKIGASVSTTGSNGKIGQYQLEAYQLWAEQINARGGLLGRPVEMVILDDQSDPTVGAKLYEKLINEDKVDLVLGPNSSAVTQAVSTVTEKYKYPMLSAGASASDIWKRNYKYVFGVYSTAETYFHGLIDFAKKNGLTTIAIINEDTVFPKATAAGTAEYAKKEGFRIVFQQQYPNKVTDLSPLITKLKASKPDVLVGGSYQPDAVLITRQAKELDFNVKMLAFSVGAAMPEFGEGLGKDADFIYGPSMWEPSLKTKGNSEFEASYKKKWNRDPDFHSATGFAGGQILEAAVLKAKSLDREKIRESLSTLETDTVLPGKYKVDDTGAQLSHVPVVIQWQGKDKPVIGPDAMANAKAKFPMPEWKSR